MKSKPLALSKLVCSELFGDVIEFELSKSVGVAPLVLVVSNAPIVVQAVVPANIEVKVTPAEVSKFGNVTIASQPPNMDSKLVPLLKSVGVNVVIASQPNAKSSKLVTLDKSKFGIVTMPLA